MTEFAHRNSKPPDLRARDTGAWLKDPAMQTRFKGSAGDHAVPGVRAVFVMAQAILQGLAPESLRRMQVPASILVGSADTVAPPATNADVVSRSVCPVRRSGASRPPPIATSGATARKQDRRS